MRVVVIMMLVFRALPILQYYLLVWGFVVVILFLALDGQEVDLAVAVLLPWSVRMIQVCLACCFAIVLYCCLCVRVAIRSAWHAVRPSLSFARAACLANTANWLESVHGD
jgi:hypothetical protein